MHEHASIDPLERAYRQSVLRDIERRVALRGEHRAQPHADRARQFMPFAALKGYTDMAHEREQAAYAKHELTAEEARVLSETMSGLSKGDSVRVTRYEHGARRVVEGVVSCKDETLKTIRIGSIDIAFGHIEAIEPLYRSDSCEYPSVPPS